MPTATTTKTARTLVAAATSNTAGSTTRGTLDLRTKFGGLLTMKITNGGTGPTLQCEGRVLVAHNAGATPTAGGAGADWKPICTAGGGTTARTATVAHTVLDQSVMPVEVEFTGNTGQTVTVEAFCSELTQIDSA